jgi:hypothetical protein
MIGRAADLLIGIATGSAVDVLSDWLFFTVTRSMIGHAADLLFDIATESAIGRALSLVD